MIPGVMKLSTLADVRELMRHLPRATRERINKKGKKQDDHDHSDGECEAAISTAILTSKPLFFWVATHKRGLSLSVSFTRNWDRHRRGTSTQEKTIQCLIRTTVGQWEL